MKKAILITILLVVVLAAVAGWWFMAHRFDDMLESEIQQAASEALGAPVRFEDASLNIFSGEMSIDELQIGNPPGFDGENVVVFGAIDISLDIKTQTVSLVALDQSRFSIEERGGETNLDLLRQKLEAHISSEADSAFDAFGAQAGSGEILVVQKFEMTNTTATFNSETLQKSSSATIARIELHDLRGTPEAIAGQIATTVIDSVMEAASQAMLENTEPEDVN